MNNYHHFQSKSVQPIVVLPERRGNVTLYPHTEQLPKLISPLTEEFLHPLRARLKRVDKRGNGYDKLLLYKSAALFSAVRAARSDRLCVAAMLNPDLVAQLTIIQQSVEHTTLGKVHRFRFYGPDGFLPEIYLSGKRLAFADHALVRFSERIPSNLGSVVSFFAYLFYTAPLISISVGSGKAFALLYGPSIIAFIYNETEEEIFIKTCLTPDQMQDAYLHPPYMVHNFHYGATFTKPVLRNWSPAELGNTINKHRKNSSALLNCQPSMKNCSWSRLSGLVTKVELSNGFGPGSSISFPDNMPGPAPIYWLAGETETYLPEVEWYKRDLPGRDWDEVFAQRDAALLGTSKLSTDQTACASVK